MAGPASDDGGVRMSNRRVYRSDEKLTGWGTVSWQLNDPPLMLPPKATPI